MRGEEGRSKSQEGGGVDVDTGEIHHPPSLALFVLLHRGSRGHDQRLVKYAGNMCVCVCVC